MEFYARMMVLVFRKIQIVLNRDNNWLIAEEGIKIISSDSNASSDSDWYDLTDS